MAHTKDVIFTENAVKDLIKQIRQNPEMVSLVREASPSELATHNEDRPTLTDGRISGHGIAVIQADGEKTYVYSGPKIENLSSTEIHNNSQIYNGEIGFKVDEKLFTVPLKGIIPSIINGADETTIPTAGAVINFIENSFENFNEDLDDRLNGEVGNSNGQGFIPGTYISLPNPEFDINEQAQIRDGLTTAQVTEPIIVFTEDGRIKNINPIVQALRTKKNYILSLEPQISSAEERIISLTARQEAITNEKAALESQIDISQEDLNTNYSEGSILYHENISLSGDEISIALSSSIQSLRDDINILRTYSLPSLQQDFENVQQSIGQVEQGSPEYEALMNEQVSIANNIGELHINIIKKRKQIISNATYNIDRLDNEYNSNNILITNLTEQKAQYQTDLNWATSNSIQSIIDDLIVQISQEGGKTWTVIESEYSPTEASLKASKVYGAVFNDYAEYRSTVAAAPGQVVIEQGDGTMRPSTKRLELGGNIVSDTFGFAIGETEYARTPIAVCGRVLAYTDADTDTFTPGAAVCSGPNGTVSMMTREEIREWPDAIIGYVSEIPTYEVWGTEQVHVNGRIWIKVK